MHRPPAVSLADFAAAGVRLRPTDAATIVHALVMQVADGRLPGVPSAHVIRLAHSGSITVEGPVVASGRPVPRAAQLLAALLPGSNRPSVEPTPLRRVIARALQDPPGFATLEELARALAPFAAHDSHTAIRELTARWAEAAQDIEAATEPEIRDSRADAAAGQGEHAEGPGGMSVSDVRRARRDTGLSLLDVSKRSRIPVSMLRQLEWGYLRNWPKGLYGRTQLVRYARAAGLNRQLVLDAMGPIIEAQSTANDVPREGPPDAAAAAGPIVIVQPTFEDDEVLFEAERTDHPAEPVVSVASVPLATVGSSGAETIGSGPAKAALSGVPADGSVAYDLPLGSRSRPVGLLDPATPAEAPRRASMIAAAAVLALATAGAVWGMRWHPPDDGRTGAPHVVRRVPVRDQAIVRSSPAANPATSRRPGASLRQSVGGVGRPISTSGVRPASNAGLIPPAADARLIPVDASEDDALGAPPAFASAGGVSFADPVQPAVGATDAAGGGLGLRITRVVDDRSRNYNARPSPDGTRVAFDSDRDGERAVFVADANGRNLRRVSGDGFAAVPNWSRDGRTLSYARAEVDNPNVWNLWALNLDSGESRKLTSNASGRPLGGTWFPDGQRIAYSNASGIVVLDVTSGKPTVYPSPQARRTAGPPAVSPDGRWVMFQLSGDGAWLLDLTDASSRKVLSDPTAGEFTWSPDGSRVAYYSRRDGEWSVWVMAAR